MSDIPIGPVLEHYEWELPPERPGQLNVKCHEHGDKRASASLNYDLGVVYCHACGFGGDAIKIIMEKEGVGFGEAVRIAETITGTSHGSVSREPQSSSSLPSAQRDKRADRKYVPTWSGPRGRSHYGR